MAEHIIPQPVFHLALPHADDADRPGDQHFFGKLLQIRPDARFKHGRHLIGRPGHEHSDFPISLHSKARGRPVVVIKDDRALRHIRLLEVVGRGLFSHFCKILHQPLIGMLVPLHLAPKICRYGLFCQIVVGRPKAARHEHEIRPGKRDGQAFLQPLRVIAHHRLRIEIDAKAGQLFCQIGRICIHNISEQ